MGNDGFQSQHAGQSAQDSEGHITDSIAITGLSQLIERRRNMIQEVNREVIQNKFVQFPNNGEEGDSHHDNQRVFPKFIMENVQVKIFFPDPDNQHRFKDTPEKMNYGIVSDKTRVASQIMETSGIFYQPERESAKIPRRKAEWKEESYIQP